MGGGVSTSSQDIPEFIDLQTFTQLTKLRPYTSEAFFKFTDYQDKITKARFEQVILTKDCYLSYEWGIDAQGRPIPARVKKLADMLSAKGFLVYSEDGSFKNHHIANSNSFGSPERNNTKRESELGGGMIANSNHTVMDKSERIRENFHYIQCFCMLLTDRYLQKLIAKPSTTSSMNFMLETNVSQKNPKLVVSSKVKVMNSTASTPSPAAPTNSAVPIPTKNQIQLEVEQFYEYHMQTNPVRGRNEFMRCCIPIYLDNQEQLQHQIKTKYLPDLPEYLQELLLSKPGVVLDDFEMDGGHQILKFAQYLVKVIVPVKQGGGLFFQSHLPRPVLDRRDAPGIQKTESKDNSLAVPYQGGNGSLFQPNLNLPDEVLLRYQQTHFQFFLQYFTAPAGGGVASGGPRNKDLLPKATPSIPLRTLQLYAKIFARQGFESPLRLIPYLLPHGCDAADDHSSLKTSSRKTMKPMSELNGDHYLIQLGIAKEHIPVIHAAVLSQIRPFLPQNITPSSPTQKQSLVVKANEHEKGTGGYSLAPPGKEQLTPQQEAKEWIRLSEKEIEESQCYEEYVRMKYEDSLSFHVRSLLRYDGRKKATAKQEADAAVDNTFGSLSAKLPPPESFTDANYYTEDFYDYFQHQQEYEDLVKLLQLRTLPSTTAMTSASILGKGKSEKKDQIQLCCKLLRQQLVILDELMSSPPPATNATAANAANAATAVPFTAVVTTSEKKELSNRLVLREYSDILPNEVSQKKDGAAATLIRGSALDDLGGSYSHILPLTETNVLALTNSTKETPSQYNATTSQHKGPQGFQIASFLPANLAMIPGMLDGPVLEVQRTDSQHPANQHVMTGLIPVEQVDIPIEKRFSFHLQIVFTLVVKLNEWLTCPPSSSLSGISTGKESEEYIMFLLEEGIVTLIMYLFEVFTLPNHSSDPEHELHGHHTHGLRLTSSLFSPFLPPPPDLPLEPRNIPSQQSSLVLQGHESEEGEREVEEMVVPMRSTHSLITGVSSPPTSTRKTIRKTVVRDEESSVHSHRTHQSHSSRHTQHHRASSRSPSPPKHHPKRKTKKTTFHSVPHAVHEPTSSFVPIYPRYLSQDQSHLCHHKTLLEVLLMLVNHLIQPSIRITSTASGASPGSSGSTTGEQIIYLFHRQQILLYLQSLLIYYFTSDDGPSCVTGLTYSPAPTVSEDCVPSRAHVGNLAILTIILETVYILLPTGNTGHATILTKLLPNGQTILDAFLFPSSDPSMVAKPGEGNPILSSELPYTHSGTNGPFHTSTTPPVTTSASTPLSSSLIELVMILLEKFSQSFASSPFSLQNCTPLAPHPLNVECNLTQQGRYLYTSQTVGHVSTGDSFQSNERYYEFSILLYGSALMMQLMSLSFTPTMTIHTTTPPRRRNYDLIFQKYRPFSVMAVVNSLLHCVLDVQPSSPSKPATGDTVLPLEPNWKLLYLTQYPRLWYLFTQALERLTYHHQKIVLSTTEPVDLFGYAPKKHHPPSAHSKSSHHHSTKGGGSDDKVSSHAERKSRHSKHSKHHRHEPETATNALQRKRTVREQLAVHLKEHLYVQYLQQCLYLLSHQLTDALARIQEDHDHKFNRFGNVVEYTEYILIMVIQLMRNLGNILSHRPDLKALVLGAPVASFSRPSSSSSSSPTAATPPIVRYLMQWIEYSIKALREQPLHKSVFLELITESLLTVSNLFTVSVHPVKSHRLHDYERWNTMLFSTLLSSGMCEILMVLCYEYSVLDIRLFVACLVLMNKMMAAPSLPSNSSNSTQYSVELTAFDSPDPSGRESHWSPSKHPISALRHSPLKTTKHKSRHSQSSYGGYGSSIGMGDCKQGHGKEFLGKYTNTGAFVFCHRMVTLGFIEKFGTFLSLQQHLLTSSLFSSSSTKEDSLVPADPDGAMRFYLPYTNPTNNTANSSSSAAAIASASSVFIYEQVCVLLIAFASSDSLVINGISRLVNKTRCEGYIAAQMKACCLLHCEGSHHWAHFYSQGILLAQAQEQTQRQQIEHHYDTFWKAQLREWLPKRIDPDTGEEINEEEEELLDAPEELLDEAGRKRKALLLLDKTSFKLLPRSNASSRPLSAFGGFSPASSRSSTVPSTPHHGLSPATPFTRKSLAFTRTQSFSTSFGNNHPSGSHPLILRNNSILSTDSNDSFVFSRTMSGIILPTASQKIPTLMPVTNPNHQSSLLASLATQQSNSWVSSNTMNHRSRPASAAFGHTITSMEALLAQPIELPSTQQLVVHSATTTSTSNNNTASFAEPSSQPLTTSEMPSDYPYTCLTSQSLVCTSCIFSCRVMYALCKQSQLYTPTFASSSAPSLFEAIRGRIEKAGFLKLLARSPTIQVAPRNYEELFTELYQSSVLPFSPTRATVALPKTISLPSPEKKLLSLKDVEEPLLQIGNSAEPVHADSKDGTPLLLEDKAVDEEELEEEKKDSATEPKTKESEAQNVRSLITTRFLSADESNLIGHRNIELVGNISGAEFDVQMNELFSIFFHDYGKFAPAK